MKLRVPTDFLILLGKFIKFLLVKCISFVSTLLHHSFLRIDLHSFDLNIIFLNSSSLSVSLGSSIGRLLFLTESSVNSIWILLQKSVMISYLNHFSVLHHNNLVSVSNGREPMSNHYSGNVTDLLSIVIDSILDSFLIHLIKSRGGLIQQKDLWLHEESTSNSDSLLLSTRKLST